MKERVTLVAVILLAIVSVASLSYSYQATSKIEDLKLSVDNKTNKVVVYQGKDAYTPVKGIDYFDGVNGTNSVSFSIKETVLKEVPVVGPIGPSGSNGKDGLDAPIQEIRVNPDNGDLESKLTNTKFWTTLITCSEYRLECPNGN